MRVTSDRPTVPSFTPSIEPRRVQLSDYELLTRVQRVSVPDTNLDLDHLSSSRGWKRVRGCTHGTHVRIHSSNNPHECRIVVKSEISAPASELLSLLRSPTESESNALLQALYGSQFIYSSVIHAIPCVERRVLSSPRSHSTTQLLGTQQLTVRTITFAHKSRFGSFRQQSSRTRLKQHHKNEQGCFVDLVTPRPNGFQLAFCTLEAADILAGKAPADRVVTLHPISGYLVAHPKPHKPETLEITFHAVFPGTVPGACDSQVAHARLVCIGRGIGRLEKVLRRRRRFRRHQRTVQGRVWQLLLHPFRGLGLVAFHEGIDQGTHHNWHCIVCTRSFLPTLRKSWRRCDLCAYRICAEPPCCADEHVTIYNRYVAPLLVCARCRECIGERERSSGQFRGGAEEDVCYTGVTLRFMSPPESELEPESERDPSGLSLDRYRQSSDGIEQ
ncbi:hypothetical protein CCR75_007552 [Bremia lactucae]|uniref:FYVE-type domain-containing protein n=1 Tax=Bremia lactucae TaxID=4779 RepID=A0A976NZY6_BRELC|nr:hypothetical protein CCR75_007552 [Bremia lactucae]